MIDDSALDSGILTAAEKRRLTRRPSQRAIVATLAFTGLIAAFMQTLVTPIVPQLPQLLHTTPSNATWVLTATLLAAAISTPISGRLGDMVGKRRVVIVLLALLLVGSVVSALSSDILLMIVGRVLQGTGLGVIALGVSILRDVLNPKSLGGAVALVSATLGIGGAIGLPISAVIAQNLDWHYLFWLSALLALVAIVLVVAVVPVSTLRTGGSFDLIGAVLFAIGLVGILLAISKGGEWGWGSPVTLGMLVGGSVVLVLWGVYELRTSNPLVDLRVAVRRTVLLTNLASITVGFAFFASAAVLPQLLESPTDTGVGLGQTLLISSLCLTPSGLVMFFLSPVAARLSAARGPRTSLVVGGVFIVLAYALAVGPDDRGVARRAHRDDHGSRCRLRLCRDADAHHARRSGNRDGRGEWSQLGHAHARLDRGCGSSRPHSRFQRRGRERACDPDGRVLPALLPHRCRSRARRHRAGLLHSAARRFVGDGEHPGHPGVARRAASGSCRPHGD